MAGAESDRRVVLHVGVPKSGTTFLQRTLRDNGEALRAAGALYPQTPDDVMFRATLDLRENHKAWGRKRRDVAGAWAQVCSDARRHPGTTLVSQELLGAASRHQITAGMSLLKGLDVHVVVTARDLARQLTAEWQEGIKHGRRAPFAEFYQRVTADHAADELAGRFHASHDVPEVLARWSEWLPAENVHVVVAGPSGTPSETLWQRFADACGLGTAAETGAIELAGREHANPSLGVSQIDLLRRVNVALDQRIVQPAYGRMVKRHLVRDLLSPHDSPRPELPLELYDALAGPAERWVKEIQGAGYVVHGDLGDLVPVPPTSSGQHPDEPDPADGLDTSASVIAELLVELERARSEAARIDHKRRSWKKRAKELKRRMAELTTGAGLRGATASAARPAAGPSPAAPAVRRSGRRAPPRR